MRTLLTVAAVLLSGCFQMTSMLTVRADGSATLRDEISLTGMARLALAEAADGGDTPFTREALAERARELGEGVELASFETTEDGYVAIYEVADVRTLRYSASTVLGSEASTQDELSLSFAFEDARGREPSTLRVIVPKPAPSKPTPPVEEPSLDADTQASAFEMARSFFEDARMHVAVTVEGEIVDTNASFVDGSTVTVFDVPFARMFDAIAEHPELMQRQSPPNSEILELINGLDGVSIQKPGTVRIRFR